MGPKPDKSVFPRGIFTIWYDQPSYGYSTPRPGRKILDSVEDARSILAYFGITRCGVVGRSGGAGRALAAAAQLEGVQSAAVIVPIAPQGDMGERWYEGMGEFNTEIFRAIFEADYNSPYSDPYNWPAYDLLQVPRRELELHRAEIMDKWAQLSRGIAPRDDLATGITARALRAYAAALKFGSEGRINDLQSLKSWGFDLNEITVPTLIWGAKQDIFTPHCPRRIFSRENWW
jgi:pimeloyl-ACP methyl ester carboxylesterase